MEFDFKEIRHVDEEILSKVISLMYKVNDDYLHLCVDDYGICLMRELPNGNYLEIYPYQDEVVWKLFDNRTELIKTKTFKW